MAVQTVFSDNLNPATGSLTARFTDATAFYIDAPSLGSEMEIDVFLQVYFPTETGERLRNLALGKLKDGVITLNEVDTETVTPIPKEFINTGLEMALFFLPSQPIFLEVFIISPDSTLIEVESKVDDLQQRLQQLEIILTEILNALPEFAFLPGNNGNGTNGNGTNDNGTNDNGTNDNGTNDNVIASVGMDATLDNFFIFL